MIKIGFIGLGKWATRYFNTIEKNFPNVKITCAARNGSTTPPDFVSSDVKIFDHWSKVVDFGIDGLIICADPKFNIEISHYSLYKHIPVMIEKPISFSVKEIEVLTELKSPPPILVNHIHLFSDHFQFIKNHFNRNSITDILSFGTNRGPYRSFSPLFDYAPHDVSMYVDLIGKTPTKTLCSKITNSIGELFTISLTNDKLKTELNVGNGTNFRQRLLYVSDGTDTAIYDDTSESKLLLNGHPVEITHDTPLKNSIGTFLGSISGIHDYRLGLDLSIETTGIIEKCREQTEF